MQLVGTAGHVDHGKSTLVRALTGVDPDRLPEEHRRGMTIELGFAAWRLRGGRSVGVVDVPGHQRLVRTMVSGAHGIDLVLLCVAADEGVMPQTREHLVVCEVLGVRRAVVALTRADLVDAEMLELARDDVESELRGSPLGGATIVATSATTGAGLDALDAAVEAALRDLPAREDLGRPRLPVDRAFSVPGFGPVVTGTLEGGTLAVGAEVVLLPSGTRARVRGVERHGAAVSSAEPGGRTAVNLAGVERDALARGMVLALPGTLRTSRRLDASLHCPRGAPAALRHGAVLRLHLGTAEVAARLRLLGADEIVPGGDGDAQLQLDAPVVAVPGDRFVLRSASPPATLGGGTVLDVAPLRHRRHDGSVLEALHARRDAAPAERVAIALRALPRGADTATLGRLTGLGRTLVDEALRAAGEGVVTVGRRHLDMARWRDLAALSAATLAAGHATDPLATGMAREEWRSRLRLPASLAADVAHRLAAEGGLVERGAELALPGHGRRVDSALRTSADAVAALLDGAGLDPPAPAALRAAGGTPEVLRLLVAERRVVRLGADVVLSAAVHEAARQVVVRHLEERGAATVAELRDALGATRRVVVPLVEQLDATRVTRRDGDLRRLWDAGGQRPR